MQNAACAKVIFKLEQLRLKEKLQMQKNGELSKGQRKRERESVCVLESVCVCVCVLERESVSEREICIRRHQVRKKSSYCTSVFVG